MRDEHIVAAQLGRLPRSPWRVATRCAFGRPQVIASPPRLDSGEPFPTLFWLTCPHLWDAVSTAESSGAAASWAGRMAADGVFADRVREADRFYRELRAEEGGGEDACASVGIAGQADPLKTKCLHAHVAAFLGGVPDPVGEAVVNETGWACGVDKCAGIAATGRERPAPHREDGD